MLRRTGFVIYNGNPKALNDVTMELVIPTTHGLVIADDAPARPLPNSMDKVVMNITPITSHFRKPGDVTVTDLGNRYEIKVPFGKVQAEATPWSEPIFVGAKESCQIRASASVFADEFDAPIAIPLEFRFNVTEKPLSELSEEEFVRLMGWDKESQMPR